MSLPEIYRLRYGQKYIRGDAIFPLVPGVPLMLTENINSTLGKHFGLVNGAIVEFYGFEEVQTNNNYITASCPTYMLVKLLQDPRAAISLPGLPTGVIPIETVKFTYCKPHGQVSLEQFPVTLAYVITDYKCQGNTFRWVIVDIKTPAGFGSGPTSAISAYVQLSRATSLDRLSIMRPFDPEDLRRPLPSELVDELR